MKAILYFATIVCDWIHIAFELFFLCGVSKNYFCESDSFIVFFFVLLFRHWIFWRPKNRPSFSRQMTKMHCLSIMRHRWLPVSRTRKFQSINLKPLPYLKKSNQRSTRMFRQWNALALKSIVRLCLPVTRLWGIYRQWWSVIIIFFTFCLRFSLFTLNVVIFWELIITPCC